MTPRRPAFRMSEIRSRFPGVADVRLTWTERGEGVPDDGKTVSVSLARNNLPDRIPCANPTCRKGGHDVTGLLKELFDAEATEGSETMACQGYLGHRHGSTDDPTGGPPTCGNEVEVEVEVDYR